jgi:hypothetical protein
METKYKTFVLSTCNLDIEGIFLDIATYDSPCGHNLRPLAKVQFMQK